MYSNAPEATLRSVDLLEVFASLALQQAGTETPQPLNLQLSDWDERICQRYKQTRYKNIQIKIHWSRKRIAFRPRSVLYGQMPAASQARGFFSSKSFQWHSLEFLCSTACFTAFHQAHQPRRCCTICHGLVVVSSNGKSSTSVCSSVAPRLRHVRQVHLSRLQLGSQVTGWNMLEHLVISVLISITMCCTCDEPCGFEFA